MHDDSKLESERWLNASTSDIVDALRSGIEPDGSSAARELGRRFEPVIRKYWRTKRTGEYKDFFQDVMVRLFSSLVQLRDSRAFPGFLYRIIVSCAADYWRRELKHVRNIEDNMLEHAESEPFDADFSIALLVRTYLEWLPPREREVLELRYLHDLDVADIAARWDVSPGAVRMTESRAKRRLQDRIALEEKEAARR